MKISKTTLFAIIFISLVISSCEPYMHKYFLTEDEMDWLRVYNKNDTILFICDVDNDIDTMVIDKCIVKNPRNHNPFDWEDKDLIAIMLETSNEIRGGGHIYYDLIHDNKNYEGILFLTKVKKSGYAKFNLFFVME